MHPLDNSVWNALTSCQEQFAEAYNLARRFPTEVTSLGAFLEPTQQGYESLARLLGPGDVCALLLKSPSEPPAGWTIVEAVPLLQMVHEECKLPSLTLEWIELGEADVPEMLALAALTKPGPFGKRTYELGTYIGLRREGRLVAMAGERLRVPGYTEVSAVCTHPDHCGHGYAGGLVAALVERIRNRREVPFLHVRPENVRAVKLYKWLGFRERLVLHMAVIRKSAQSPTPRS
jgi:ribosomal protein S18 acetylase RimI-like enzyme